MFTWQVDFQHTYRTEPSTHFPKGHVKTVHRRKIVKARNVSSAISKARRGFKQGGRFHHFTVEKTRTTTFTEVGSSRSQPQLSL